MKIQYKAAIIMTLFGSLIVLFLSYGFDMQNHNIAINNELQNIQNLSKEISLHLQSHIKEKASIALTLTTAPCFKEALQQSNSQFTSLTSEKRNLQINNLNKRWRNIKNITDPFIQSYMTNTAGLYLKDQQKIMPGMYGEIFLTNRYGALVATTGKLTTLAHAHKYWWIASYSNGEGRIFLDDRGYDESADGYVLGIVVPIKDKDEIIGILKCNVNIAGSLTNSVEEYDHHTSGQLKIVRTGGLVVREVGAPPLSTRIPDSILGILQEKRIGTLTISDKGTNKLVATAPVPITMGSAEIGFGGSKESINHIKGNTGEGWHVVISVLEEKALEVAHHTTQLIIFASLVFLVLSSIVALFLGRIAAKPIVLLADDANRIGEGNLQTRTTVSSNDEIGSLAQSLNMMAENLEMTLVSRDELINEVKQRIEAENKLHILASTDELTGAYNRRAFFELMKKNIYRANRYNEPLSVMLFDIDHFKKVNDTHGHDIGDQVLKSLVRVVLDNIRQEDLLARWGGEEFIVAMPQTPQQAAMDLAERLRNNIASYKFPKVGNVTVSLGLAEFHCDNDDNMESCIKRADNALYKAKDSGRNMTVFFHFDNSENSS